MSAPVVAIVIRTKDRPDFLVRALQSVTRQSFGDWECVIVNDGGDPAVVAGLVADLDEEHRARIRVVDAPVSRGRWKSANAGVLATTAPLIVLHDDDDSWHPDFLGRAVAYLDANPDRGAVVSRIEIVWEQHTGDRFVEQRREVFQAHLSAPLLSDALLYNRFVPIGFVYRRRLHEELGLYDESLPVVGDWAFNLRVLAHGPLEYLQGPPLAFWHQRVGASGAHGNSVIDARGQHDAVDARLRDDALREYVSGNGLGLVLYLTKFIDQRLVDVENGLRRDVVTNSLIGRMRERRRRRRARRDGIA